MSLSDIPLDDRNERDPCNNISDTNGDESQSKGNGTEVPLIVHQSERLDEHEDKSITETTKK